MSLYLEEVSCTSCLSRTFRPLQTIPIDFELQHSLDKKVYAGPFHIVECVQCGQVLQNPRPNADRIGDYYPDEYDCFSEWPPSNPLKRALYHAKMSILGRRVRRLLPQGGVILDFGCGNGHLIRSLSQMLPKTYTFIGIDFSPTQVERLKRDGIEAYLVDATGSPKHVLSERRVDLIMMNHVIEHVPDPWALMRDLHHILNDGGHILGETPNCDAWDRTLFGKYWAGWHAPRHFYLFDFRGIRRLAESQHFHVRTVKSDLSAASHWAISLNYLLSEFVFKNYRKNRLPLYLLLLLFFIPIAAAQMPVTRLSVMRFHFQKPLTRVSA